MLIAALIGALFASLATILALNFVAAEKRIEKKITHQYGVAAAQFDRELGTLLGPAIIDGNAIINLENGAEIFPSMLNAVRGARRSITLETYIYWSGDIGDEFADALAERARAGVKVHLLVDWVGSQRMDAGMMERMRSVGVQIERYHPLHWYHLGRMNNRTHRKLLVVDGRIGYTGGVGIADQWSGNAQDEEHWRDSHYRVEGPAVGQMQAAFMDNWIKTTGEVLRGEDYFPAPAPVGKARAQVFTSSPSGGGDSMHLMYLLAIAAAEHRIDLAAAYFVPDQLTRRALRDALRRGVRVRVLVPGKRIDAAVVRQASRADWGELLVAGAEFHEYSPTMMHCKMLVVDERLVSVGSTNFDNRSFRLNDEANLNVYDTKFAQTVTAVFEADLLKSRRISHADWLARPWRAKVLEQLSTLFSSQL